MTTSKAQKTESRKGRSIAPSPKEGQVLSGAQQVIAALEAEGVTTLFGYPGGTVIDIYDALYDSEKLHHVLVRHEQGAAHAADGYARATGKPGVCLVTSGPGATNTVTGIATAYMDSVPMVILTGQVATAAIGTDAFQESDITGITLPITKHSYLVKDVHDLPRVIHEAFHIATTGRPGPVLVDLPSDISKAKCEFHYPVEEPNIPSYKPTYRGHSKQIKQAARYIAAARRPVIYAGGGIIASNAEDELLELAELMQIPVTTTLMAKGAFPYDNPLALGMPGMHGARYTNMALSESDLIIALGTRFSDRVIGRKGTFARNAKVIHADIDPAEIGKNRAVDVPIVGDVRGIIAGIVAELRRTEAKPKSLAWVDHVDEMRSQYPMRHPVSEAVIMPEVVIERLNALTADRDTIVTTEVGQHQMWAAQFLNTRRPRSFISSGGLGTMGFGFPAAIGAQAAYPDSLVVCLAGDGSFQMNSQEMATAKAAGLPVKVIIFDNQCLGMVRQWQQLFYHGRYSQTLFDDSIVNFVALGHAYGWHAAEVSDPAQLDEALKDLINSEGPALLNVQIAQSELVLPMVAPGSAIDESVAARNVAPTIMPEGKGE